MIEFSVERLLVQMDLYKAIYARRDIRAFRPDPISDETLLKILNAAHHAGSVGFMQPWDFTVVRDPQTRSKIAASHVEEHRRAAENYSGQRRELYQSLRLGPIESSALNIAVTCDHDRNGPHVVGRNTMPETDLYSTVCAVQNLWLAACAEGIGMCWVSVIDPTVVKAELGIPIEVALVAYLCLGVPAESLDRPMLEKVGWQSRAALSDVVHLNRWNQPWKAATRSSLGAPTVGTRMEEWE